MKAEIAYSGINKNYLEGIRTHLRQNNPVFTPIEKDNYKNVLQQEKDVLLIGEEISNPIRLAQEAYSVDNSLSILIISDPSHYKNLKQAILFTPFIGSTINCIPNGDEKNVANTINGLITQTQQRRNFEFLKRVPIPVHSSPRIEQLKKEYINKFFEKAPIGAILLDHDSGMLGLNYHASEVMNAQETELLGNKLYNFFPDIVKPQLNEFLDSGYKSDPKKIFIKSLSPEQFIEISITEVKVEANFIYKIAIVEDITEKVIKDKQIENQITELKKINNDLDNFIYTASHDLKAPISNIEGLIYTLKDVTVNNPDVEEQKQILDLIEKSILRFKGTIQDLSEIAKVQRQTEEGVTKIDIKEGIAEVLEMLDKEIKITNTVVTLNTNNCSLVYLSKSNFKSIFYNLISNAIKYNSPKRKPIIEITCDQIPHFISIQIKDNGLGVSKNNLPKMFSMFKRFHDHVEGTGIGLYIVKRIIDNAGGKIEVESEVGKGTIFKVYLRT